VRHPCNGREILFVNPSHTHGFVGMAREGTALINALADHAAQPAFVYHHRWRVGDLVIWDQVSIVHKGAGDSPPDQRRMLMRIIAHPANLYWTAAKP
jgi:taurine dioxygenase